MNSVEFWALVASSFLLLPCVIANLLFVGLGFGLWKGSAWVREHAQTGLLAVDRTMQKAAGWLEYGEGYVVAPFVRVRAGVERVRTTWRAIRE